MEKNMEHEMGNVLTRVGVSMDRVYGVGGEFLSPQLPAVLLVALIPRITP